MKKTSVIIIVLILVIGFLLAQNLSLKNQITGAASADNVLTISSSLKKLGIPETPIEIKKLTEPELSQLKQEQPVIYSDTKEGDYVVTYTDKLIVYDYKDNRIIRDFVVQNLEIK